MRNMTSRTGKEIRVIFNVAGSKLEHQSRSEQLTVLKYEALA